MKNTSVPIHRKSVTKRTGIDKVFRIIGIIIMSLLSLSYVYIMPTTRTTKSITDRYLKILFISMQSRLIIR